MLEKLWVLKVKIFWHHNGPFGSLSNHYSSFFKWARSSLTGLMCCPHFFRVFGFDRSCISFSFLARWSFYFSWCGGTCKDRYLSLPSSTTRYMCNVTWSCLITCFAFEKSSGAILFSNAVFFDGPITQAKIYFTLANIPSDVMRARFCFCAGPIVGA